jgi:cytoskeleton protein RodZ
MPEIGETLREARRSGRIDVSEIEAETKIRAKYLRALENEEWDLLPGSTYVKSFLRTYGDALGLDGKALVEEYRKSVEPPSDPIEPIAGRSRRLRGGIDGSQPRRARAGTEGGQSRRARTGAEAGQSRRARGASEGRPSRRARNAIDGGPSRGYLALLAIVSAVIVLLIIGLVSSTGSPSKSSTDGAGARNAAGARDHRAATSRPPASRVVTVSIQATSTVYVCLLGEGGRVLVPGRTLLSGEKTPTFAAKHFELTLGNAAVNLVIDGTRRIVRPSATAISYSITKLGRRPLEPGNQPTCT